MSTQDINMKMRPTVLALFIIYTIIIISLILSLQYFFLKDLAFKATQDNIKHISEKIEVQINSLDKKNNDIISMIELYKDIQLLPKEKEKHSLLPIISSILKNNNSLYSIYLGNEKKEFYQVINLSIDKKLISKFNTTKEMKWLIIKIYDENKKRIKIEQYLDKNLKLIKTVRKKAVYDPTVRPWYISASKNKDIIKTEPYKYSSLNAHGISYAKKIKSSSTIIGLDVSLKSMDYFLKNQLTIKESEIFLLRENTAITSRASLKNNKNEMNYEEIEVEYLSYLKDLNINSLKNQKSIFKSIKVEKEDYFFYTNKLNIDYNTNEYLAIMLPINNIMQPYNQKIFYSFIATLIVLLLIIPLVWLATKLLVSPIHELSEENEKISNRRFSEVKVINTSIKEINELSLSLVRLSKSIQKHEKDQRELMDSFIKLIASAIDAKSKYTGGHCERVPILTMKLAKEASKDTSVFKYFTISNENEERELNIAAWLHDCGKVTTPEYVVDKATKLETIYNRIHEIRTRFEVIHRDLTIKSLENILKGADEKLEKIQLEEAHTKLFLEFEKIANANIGGEFMSDESINEVEKIAKRTWTRYFDNTLGISRDERKRLNRKEIQTPQEEQLISNGVEHIIERDYSLEEQYKNYNFKQEVPKDLYNLGELYNLSIRKGTLTKEERFKINEHVIMTIIMLEELPFLDNLKNVPEYAGGHHETLIGTGYPKQLTKEQMSVPARILAIADVFEALTSSDRPYKEPKTLSESIKILSFMVKDQHLDEDLFKLFLESGVYKEYAKEYLEEHQIDEVDISKYI
jgi:HD-GYP domain-containing protein (c-di-GMP phosphodiesterase class II)